MSRTYYGQDPVTGEVIRSPVPLHHESARIPLVTDRFMDGHASADGVDIGSRNKRRAYMQANDLVDASDVKGMVAKGAAERRALREGRSGSAEIREALRRAWETKR